MKTPGTIPSQGMNFRWGVRAANRLGLWKPFSGAASAFKARRGTAKGSSQQDLHNGLISLMEATTRIELVYTVLQTVA